MYARFFLKILQTHTFLHSQTHVVAELLADSTEPFESIVLKFLKHHTRDSKNGLKRYLELKLNKMDRNEVIGGFYWLGIFRINFVGTFLLHGCWNCSWANYPKCGETHRRKNRRIMTAKVEFSLKRVKMM